MNRIVKKLLWISMGLLFCLGLVAQEVALEVMDIPDVPNIGFLPLQYSYAVGTEAGDQAFFALAKRMVETGNFDPFRLNLEAILTEAKLDKAENIEQIVSLVKKFSMALDYVCQGTVFKYGKHYCFGLALYPVSDDYTYSYYYRYYMSAAELPLIAQELESEMVERSKRYQEIEHQFSKTLYIDTTVPRYYVASRNPAGEIKLDLWNLTKVNDTNYKEGDNFFNFLLIYNLHQSRLFNLRSRIINGNNFKSNGTIPADVDYIITSNILISEENTIWITRINEKKSGNLVSEFEFPFPKLNYFDFDATMKKIALMITQLILDEQELKKIGLINTRLNATGSTSIYIEGYYLGKGDQSDILQPVGSVILRTTNTTEIKFVPPLLLRPYIEDGKLFKEEILSQMR